MQNFRDLANLLGINYLGENFQFVYSRNHKKKMLYSQRISIENPKYYGKSKEVYVIPKNSNSRLKIKKIINQVEETLFLVLLFSINPIKKMINAHPIKINLPHIGFGIKDISKMQALIAITILPNLRLCWMSNSPC